jgi:myo-inositol-1-phosphate synthase
MKPMPERNQTRILLLVAGLGGAIGTTVAAAATLMQVRPEQVAPYLTTPVCAPDLPAPMAFQVAGWDTQPRPLVEALAESAIVPGGIWREVRSGIEAVPLLSAPPVGAPLKIRVETLLTDIEELRRRWPHHRPVLANLLPAAVDPDLTACTTLEALLAHPDAGTLPDLAYVLAALKAGIPVINFTPNRVEIPPVAAMAAAAGVPLLGRDGKTGQTFFKVVLASALKARGLRVDGWYSLNILGNADGANLDDPGRAAGKLANKTRLLDEILGYPVTDAQGRSTHKVRIDYYPPRGDAKEAWDAIDFSGLFDLPMSLRLDLQGRDSILAAPLVLDLARWSVALMQSGIAGPVSDLGFYFKKPVGDDPPITFAQQLAALDRLAERCRRSHP